MPYEYKVLPAPRRGRKAAGVKSPEARFALGIEDEINGLAQQGWEYLRSDILPSEERQGLTSTHTVYRSVLVFRRALPGSAAEDENAGLSQLAEQDAATADEPDDDRQESTLPEDR